MNPIEQLESVLLDPSGVVSINGSTADKKVVRDALEALRAENADLAMDCEKKRGQIYELKKENAGLAARVGELEFGFSAAKCYCEPRLTCLRCGLLALPTPSAASRLRDDVLNECAAALKGFQMLKEGTIVKGSCGDMPNEKIMVLVEASEIIDAIRARKSKP